MSSRFFVLLAFFKKILYMWGNIATESSFQTNFNVGFSNTKSDILIHLSQWQYWWWFWFVFLWSLYFMLILRVVRFRTLKFQPRIVTSFRPHGKWGDLLVCLIPTTWCINILINSSFLLKLIEWQNESSLFTIRIRGRQWYWIYKFDLKDMTNIISAAKNVGHNRWFVSVNNADENVNDYLHLIQLRAADAWLKKYWKVPLKQQARDNYDNTEFFFDNRYFFNRASKEMFKDEQSSMIEIIDSHDGYFRECVIGNNLNEAYAARIGKNNIIVGRDIVSRKSALNAVLKNNYTPQKSNTTTGVQVDTKKNNSKEKYLLQSKYPLQNAHTVFDENLRWVKRNSVLSKPVKIVKSFNDFNLFKVRFSNNTNTIISKNISEPLYLVIKQKRYTLKKKILEKNFKVYSLNNKKTLFKKSNFFLNNGVSENSIDNLSKMYKFFKKNKKRDESFSVTTTRRLLRTKRTLVLPVHVNITAITNSYDVVHSWFIPGLGLKLDCVPGRATHHTFYVDNVGFYYGQCAEICGRYHHHMPIRLCVLPYEQFLVWWQHFGLPKLMFSGKNKQVVNNLYIRKYIW